MRGRDPVSWLLLIILIANLAMQARHSHQLVALADAYAQRDALIRDQLARITRLTEDLNP